ncbi:DUF1615 domain-containing protein [Curvibacter sp. APW13]|uniref:DUF1615 domain-containing protein n=1 Tax=Curvibacter sp. APW13 TaxID=3077236 RepID=UPI0028E05BEC|nr:DUF1615 domain-containing protein [Curvibacter sp. APW13]MDT8991383.1 DUF1615 domain-containing protein [Curvibacter sp. APW13]
MSNPTDRDEAAWMHRKSTQAVGDMPPDAARGSSAGARALALLGLVLLASCASVQPPAPGPVLPPDLHSAQRDVLWTDLDDAAHRERVVRLIPGSVKDRIGWAVDLQLAFSALKIVPAAPSYCAVIAVVEQESCFQTDPVVAGLPAIVQRELERRADKYSIPMLLVNTALLVRSPNGRSYRERIDALKTEKELSDLFDDMLAELPFGKDWLADRNPVHTAGPMQVSIRFAEQHTARTPYPYTLGKRVRDDVFTRRGGLYFGAAILLDYAAPYDDVLYRFADFNAGQFSSRNAAFQRALARLARTDIAPDGDLLRYDTEGLPSEAPSQEERALQALASPLGLSPAQIRSDLLLEKTASFGSSRLYERVFALAQTSTSQPLPRQAMPKIDLSSPKITRKLTTEWFAQRVLKRYQTCLARDAAAGG